MSKKYSYKFIKYTILILSLLNSCSKKEILYPATAVTLFSNYPDTVAFGDNEVKKNFGYGQISYNSDGAVTYPALFLSNNDPITGNNVILISDYYIEENIKKLLFRIYLNYSEKSLRNLEILIIPLKSKPDLTSISYSDIINDKKLNYAYIKHFYFNISKTESQYNIKSIPIDKTNTFLTFDLTDIAKQIENGFVIKLSEKNSPKYITSMNGIISGSGIMEFASPKWEKWNGKVPDNFSVRDYKWKTIKNYGYKNKKYSPLFICY